MGPITFHEVGGREAMDSLYGTNLLFQEVGREGQGTLDPLYETNQPDQSHSRRWEKKTRDQSDLIEYSRRWVGGGQGINPLYGTNQPYSRRWVGGGQGTLYMEPIKNRDHI